MSVSSKVLVVTSRDDAHADHVIDRCNRSGLSDTVVRLNTEDFVSNCIVSFDTDSFSMELVDSGRIVRSNDIRSVWYRRPLEPEILNEPDEGVREWIKKQSTACLRGLYFSTHDTALWVNPLPALHRARHKLQQLSLARSLGFQVPRTCVTNDPRTAGLFTSSVSGRVCTKSLEEPNFTVDGHLYPFLTRMVSGSEEIRANSDGIRRCPILLQEYIEKTADIRVVCIGQKLFAVSIASQDNPLSRDDFRGVAPGLLRHTTHELPDSVARLIRAFVQHQNLQFSALDIVLSANGDYFFLENNPNGQWLWLEHCAGVPLTEAMLDLLLGTGREHRLQH